MLEQLLAEQRLHLRGEAQRAAVAPRADAESFCVALASLYALLYGILSSEDYALLMGALLVFGLLPTSHHLAHALESRVPMPGQLPGDVGVETLKVWSARLADPGTPVAAPGTIVAVDQDGICVACGDGALWLLRLQRPGGKRVSAREFLQARPLSPGLMLG